jgi:hypothetical protein
VAAGDFTAKTVETIAKRAGNHCSNPDCFASTSGPSTNETAAINVGEAAHIYGAKIGSARHNVAMADDERSDITNAIWLCRNCHKMVDADADHFPAELLFEWRRAHEQLTLESLGKAGALLRQKVLQRKLIGFENSSYLAQQIIIDKPPYWEYKLTAELLRSLLEPIKKRWDALVGGLYALPQEVVALDDYLSWTSAQLETITGQNTALTRLVDQELGKTWGPPGQPGSETDILRVCSLIAEACQRSLHWEESIRFTTVPEAFVDAHRLFEGIAARNIRKIFEIPVWMTDVFAIEKPTGQHTLNIVFDLPPSWPEDIKHALDSGVRLIEQSGRSIRR